MLESNALEAFAGISVGIAGFSAIVIALAANTVLYEVRRLSWALYLIFGWSLGAMFFSVLPYIFQFFGMAESLVWRISLLVMGGYTTIFGASAMLIDRRLNQKGLSLRGGVRDAPVKRSREMWIANGIYTSTAVMLIVAGVWQPIPGFYLVGMTVMFILSLWVLLFVFFLMGFATKGRKN